MDFVVLSLIFFAHCFDLKDLNLNNCFKHLTKNLLFTLQHTWSDQMFQMHVVYASRSDRLKKLAFLASEHMQVVYNSTCHAIMFGVSAAVVHMHSHIIQKVFR